MPILRSLHDFFRPGHQRPCGWEPASQPHHKVLGICRRTAVNEWLTWGYDRSGPSGTAPRPSRQGQRQSTRPEVEDADSHTRAGSGAGNADLSSCATVNGPQGRSHACFVVGSDNAVYAVDAATGTIN